MGGRWRRPFTPIGRFVHLARTRGPVGPGPSSGTGVLSGCYEAVTVTLAPGARQPTPPEAGPCPEAVKGAVVVKPQAMPLLSFATKMLVVTDLLTPSPPIQTTFPTSTNPAQLAPGGAGGTLGFGPSVTVPAAMKPLAPWHVVPAGPVALAWKVPRAATTPADPKVMVDAIANRVNVFLISCCSLLSLSGPPESRVGSRLCRWVPSRTRLLDDDERDRCCGRNPHSLRTFATSRMNPAQTLRFLPYLLEPDNAPKPLITSTTICPK